MEIRRGVGTVGRHTIEVERDEVFPTRPGVTIINAHHVMVFSRGDGNGDNVVGAAIFDDPLKVPSRNGEGRAVGAAARLPDDLIQTVVVHAQPEFEGSVSATGIPRDIGSVRIGGRVVRRVDGGSGLPPKIQVASQAMDGTQRRVGLRRFVVGEHSRVGREIEGSLTTVEKGIPAVT